MKKKILAMLVVVLAVAGCNEQKAKQEQPKQEQQKKIVLTQYEQKLANGNTNIMAELLIRNAILEEIKNAKLTPEQQEAVEFVKNSAEVDYYLKNNIIKPVNITQEEVQSVYDQNKKNLGDQKFENVAPQIANLIAKQKQNQELINYYNSLIAKYDLNTALKEQLPKKEEVKNNEVKNTEDKAVDNKGEENKK